MLGLMDLEIDRVTNQVRISNVVFDRTGGIDLKGSLKRRVEEDNEVKQEQPKFRSVVSCSVVDVYSIMHNYFAPTFCLIFRKG